jgi:hypothetical protein
MTLPTFKIRHPYSIGRLLTPAPDDQQFAELDAAEIAAVEASGDDCVYGVWENKSGELLAICYQQTVFHP